MNVFTAPGKHPIKAWTEGVLFEPSAFDQVSDLASLPFIHRHIAVMPDVHAGIGSTVGTVMATSGAIIPAAVGVDIGCGMMAIRLDLRADQLPDNLHGMRSAIEAAVPHGRTDNGGPNDEGSWPEAPDWLFRAWGERLLGGYQKVFAKHPKLEHRRAVQQLCSLGTGNHFIEVCLDEAQRVWVMLHSGSRGAGNAIGMHFIGLAKKEMERWFIHLPNKDLAYLPEGSEHFADYMDAVSWAQDYAALNRQLMMNRAVEAISDALGRVSTLVPHEPYAAGTEFAINCHHNYVARENHFGENVLVTRKGAVRARKGDLGIIPGSMGAKSFIVRGRGNRDSFHSCSHGAGRTMSRTEARKTFSLADHAKATEGVECRKDESVLDETPAAYKSIDAVMTAQEDLVEVVHILKQVLCVKG